MRIFVLILLAAVLSFRVAAQTVFAGKVTDAKTGEPLPFATVSVENGRGTVCNAEGGFALLADSGTVAAVSFVGYKTVRGRLSELGREIRLRRSAVLLREVVVRPFDEIMKAITKNARRQLGKRRRRTSTFFYRQTSFADSTCSELLEAFMRGRSAVSLRDLSLVKGRYAALKSDSVNVYPYFTNFFTFSQIELVCKDEAPLLFQDVMPLTDVYRDFYDVGYHVEGDSAGRMYVIDFTPKPDVRRPVVECRLHVDAATLNVLKYEGRGRNMRVLDKCGSTRQIIPVEMDFVMNYSSEKGYMEVSSAYVHCGYMLRGRRVSISSLLYNVGKYGPGDVGGIAFNDDLRRKIEAAGYDPAFWAVNEVVRRTPVEDRVARLFENRNLFGVFK